MAANNHQAGASVSVARPDPNVAGWLNDIANGVGKYVNLETSDGVVRGGKLTAIHMREIRYNNRKQNVITDIELNGDPSDTIPLMTVIAIELR